MLSTFKTKQRQQQKNTVPGTEADRQTVTLSNTDTQRRATNLDFLQQVSEVLGVKLQGGTKDVLRLIDPEKQLVHLVRELARLHAALFHSVTRYIILYSN